MLPPVIFLECDFGADWPTWVPNRHEPPESSRTSYFAMTDVPLTPGLRDTLLGWQRGWELLNADIDEPDHAIDEDVWVRFVNEGRALAVALQGELGDQVEVRFEIGF